MFLHPTDASGDQAQAPPPPRRPRARLTVAPGLWHRSPLLGHHPPYPFLPGPSEHSKVALRMMTELACMPVKPAAHQREAGSGRPTWPSTDLLQALQTSGGQSRGAARRRLRGGWGQLQETAGNSPRHTGRSVGDRTPLRGSCPLWSHHTDCPCSDPPPHWPQSWALMGVTKDVLATVHRSLPLSEAKVVERSRSQASVISSVHEAKQVTVPI